MAAKAGTVDGIFSAEALAARVESGHVRVRAHPTEPLVIANYTSRAAIDGVWDPVTLSCRGLIWNPQTGAIAARPFAKFFDLHETSDRVPDSPPLAHEKLDGSLGILYRTSAASAAGAGWAVATRGSFDSEQAEWATAHLRRRYPGLDVPEGVTPLVEIVYPANRIVVDHGHEDLVLLGAIDHTTGADVPLWEVDWWPGPVAAQHVVGSAHDGYLLATSDAFAEAEGLVLTWLRPGRPSLRAKVKHPRYLELHRIITESSERDVWRSLVAGDWRGRIGSRIVGRVLDVSDTTVDSLPVLEELEPALPDGVRARLLAVTDRLRAEHAVVVATVDALWVERPADGDRRAFATWASASPYRGLLFARLDGKSWQLDAWSHVRPEAVPLAAG